VRCVQTVQPLADRCGIKVEETEALAEGANPPEVVRLAREAAGEDGAVVLCTHGDVIPTLLDTLALTDGLKLPEDYPCAKGSTWRHARVACRSPMPPGPCRPSPASARWPRRPTATRSSPAPPAPSGRPTTAARSSTASGPRRASRCTSSPAWRKPG